MDNLEYFNIGRVVPDKAKKTIQAGRLKGMTDIRPMWRIEKLTEMFGPVGIGWNTKTLNKEIIEGANGEKIAVVDIHLFVKYKGIDGEWSEPIEGSGGSSFISKEKNGYYTSDECFKMAFTDALSVACKSIGIGADVYWGDSKYNKPTTESNKQESRPVEKMATKEQLQIIMNLDVELKDKLRNTYKKDVAKLSYKEAYEAINSLKKHGLIKNEQKGNGDVF